MKKSKLPSLVLAAMFSAMIAVSTMFVKIPVPIANGYVHLGDTLIYIASCVLPLPYALLAAAVGGGVADIAGGYAIYAPATIIIKALLTLSFSCKGKFICGKNILASALSLPITAGGYFLYEWALYSFGGALASLPWNILQAVGTSILFITIGALLDKSNVKNKIFK